MSDIIRRDIDVENVIREATKSKFTVYCRPLPENFTVPCLLVQLVGGTEEDTIGTYTVVVDSRAEDEETAMTQLRNFLGYLRKVAGEQTTPIRIVRVNTSASWGADPVRPELAMCSSNLDITAHLETAEI